MAKVTHTSNLPDETVGEALGYIAKNLRQADRDEVKAMLDVDPLWGLVQSVEVSTDAWIVTDNTGLPYAVFGVAPMGLKGVGNPWLMATDALQDDAISFARQTPRFVQEAHKDYPVLTNFVDARNTASIDWLLFAGFNLIDAHTSYGPEERLFLQFSRSL